MIWQLWLQSSLFIVRCTLLGKKPVLKKMRRNVRKLLKFIAATVVVVICGAVLFKSFLTINDIDSNAVKLTKNYGGLPKDPERYIDDQKQLGSVKKDWHDYAAIVFDAKRSGPGEQGIAFYLPQGNEIKKDDLYKVNGFNGLVSDFIALNRSIADIRHPKKKKYLRKLPQASIVVPFHNEHLSTLLRTVISVLNRAPPELLKEVILVDDFSTKVELRNDLDEYIKENLPKVKVVRAVRREGLIRARLLGAQAAVGDVLIFLDSHTEANINWLPPLLEPIALDRRTVVCPFIDVIDYDTFAYRAQDEGARGSFDWEFYYKRLPVLPEDAENPADPFKSPVMAGGLFAIDRSFFWELGGYDEGLDVWGGEQYELSFKIWQCGGQMLDIPCSRIGHIYRKFAPFPNPGIGDFVGRNYKRVAEVWMDEYKEYLYMRRPHYRKLNAGDISKQKALRKNLNCKPFKWFMKNIAFDQPLKYPGVEPLDFAWGEIRNEANGLCLDTKFRNQNEKFGLEKCLKENAGEGGEQQFVFTWHRDIRPKKRNVCLDVSTSEDRAPVMLWSCHGLRGNQEWKYNAELLQLRHPISNKCLDCDTERQDLFMRDCNPALRTQHWNFENFNKTALESLL